MLAFLSREERQEFGKGRRHGGKRRDWRTVLVARALYYLLARNLSRTERFFSAKH
jgi:hypothetical protein